MLTIAISNQARYLLHIEQLNKTRVINIIDTHDNNKIVDTATIPRSPMSGGYGPERTRLTNLCKQLNEEFISYNTNLNLEN